MNDSPAVSATLSDVIPPEFYPAQAVPALPAPQKTIPERPDTARPDPVPDAAVSPAAPVSGPAPAPRGGFLPLLLGGLVAGAIGFAVASLTNPPASGDLDQLLAAQDARITALQQDLAAQAPADLTPLTQAQDALGTRLAAMQSDIDSLRAELDARMADLPQSTATGQAPDTSMFEAEIDALRTQLDEMTGIARTELDAARAEVAAIEENAAAAAARAAGRAALARLQVSVETGAPLGAALNDLQDALGAPPPDVLLSAQDGVPTLATLQESFPAYARAALTTARAQGVSGEASSGIGAFLRNQFAVRSVNPQEGDTADAVLSRAQAAVRSGRIADALTEISALPDVARADMAEWVATAETRVDAVAAIDTLATSLRDN